MNKKIAFIGNTDWYLSNFRGPLIRAAQEAGWQPVLVCPAGRYADRMADQGYAVHRLALNNDGMNPLRELRVLWQLWRLLRRERPAIIHLFTLKCVLYGALVAPFAGRPATVAAITGMGTVFTGRGPTRLLKLPLRHALRLAFAISGAHVIFQNTHDRDECVQWRLIPQNRTSVIRGSGVDCERFHPDESSQHRPGLPPRLLFAARLLGEKGIGEYLKATARLRGEGLDFVSRIAGDRYPGNPDSLTRAEVDAIDNDPRHDYLGHRDDMPEILRQTDIIVLPTTYREGTPKSLIEGAASGCVIVTTDIPACAGVVEHGVNGYLVPPRDTKALTDTLRQLINMPAEKRREMGHAGREIMQKNFSTETVNNATLKIYDRVTTQSL